MALTNFAALTEEELTVWSRDFWRVARNASFINQFAGTGPNSMVQRITELTKNEKGARAVITLLADMQEDGTTVTTLWKTTKHCVLTTKSSTTSPFCNRLAGRMVTSAAL